MANIRIVLDPDQLTPGDMLDMQELTKTYLMNVLAKYAVDSKGKRLNKWDALKYLDAFEIEELQKLMKQLIPQMESLLEPKKE